MPAYTPFTSEPQLTALPFTTLQAYMLVDLFCFLLPLTPNDFLFVGHHIMTATYMMSSVVRAVLQFPLRGSADCVLSPSGQHLALTFRSFYHCWITLLDRPGVCCAEPVLWRLCSCWGGAASRWRFSWP